MSEKKRTFHKEMMMMMEKFLVTRQCYWLNKAWFNTQDRPHEIMFGVYTVDGGLIGGAVAC